MENTRKDQFQVHEFHNCNGTVNGPRIPPDNSVGYRTKEVTKSKHEHNFATKLFSLREYVRSITNPHGSFHWVSVKRPESRWQKVVCEKD